MCECVSEEDKNTPPFRGSDTLSLMAALSGQPLGMSQCGEKVTVYHPCHPASPTQTPACSPLHHSLRAEGEGELSVLQLLSAEVSGRGRAGRFD